jgi:membrane protease YdiL (CAAX protease family)
VRTSGTGLRFAFGFAVLWSALDALGRVGDTSIDHGVAAAVALIGIAVYVETRIVGTARREAGAQLGLGRPSRRGLAAGLLVALITVAALPAYALITGENLELRSGWPWLALSLLAYHGVAEELCWRGYTFGHFRRSRTFRAAVIATMPYIAITHLPVTVESGPAVGIAAIALAAITCIPLAHLYELGGRTIWACAPVHAAIDSFKLVDHPDRYVGLTAAITIAALVCPFVALAWSRRTPETVTQSHLAHPAHVLERRVLHTTRKELS